jgi:hypothetical protein
MVKYVLAVLVAAMMASPAFAGSRSHATANSGSSSGAYSNSGSYININSRGYRGTGTAIPPGLVASGLSCSGSVSAGAGFMGGALSFGFTHKDKDCDTRENAKMVGLLHEMNVAYEMMCGIDEVREADARSGRNRCVLNRRGVSYHRVTARHIGARSK